MSGTRRKRVAATAEDLPEGVRRSLEQIQRLAIAAHCGGGGQDRGPEALFRLLEIFPPPVCRDNQSRDEWLELIEWLARSGSLPAMNGLQNALEEFGRGFPPPALQVIEARGGKSRTSVLRWYRLAIEADDEIAWRIKNHALASRGNPRGWGKDRDYLVEYMANVPRTTLATWRRTLAKEGTTEVQPRFGWALRYGRRSPFVALKLAVRKIEASEPRRRRLSITRKPRKELEIIEIRKLLAALS